MKLIFKEFQHLLCQLALGPSPQKTCFFCNGPSIVIFYLSVPVWCSLLAATEIPLKRRGLNAFFFSLSLSLSLSAYFYHPSTQLASKQQIWGCWPPEKKGRKSLEKISTKTPRQHSSTFTCLSLKKNVSGPRLFFRPSGAARWLLIFFFQFKFTRVNNQNFF